MAGGTNPRREAAACVERGIERYAEGQFAAAQRELETALSLHPGHPRALECLGWVREIAAGRRAPSSDKYAAIEVDDYGPEPLQPTRAGIPTRTTGTRIPSMASSPQISAQPPSLADRPTGRTMLGLAAVKVPPGPIASEPLPELPHAPSHATPHPMDAQKPGDQLGETPESVTREWSTIATSSLPQLDVPELSEEQIANLLDMDRSQGITLSAGKLDVSEPYDEDDDEIDRTNVRSASELEEPERVYEMVAEPEDDEDDEPSTPFGVVRVPEHTPPDPMLTPLSSSPAPVQRARVSSTSIPSSRSSQQLRANEGTKSTPRPEARINQTSDDAPSLPTNPFVQQKLASMAQLFAGPSGLAQLEAALSRGDAREIFDLAEQLAERGAGGRADEELLVRAYESVIGDLGAVPRLGKPSSDLDPRSAFLLSQMDGATSIDDILDVSGMPRRDALRVLARLVHAGSIRV